ncbi:MAG: TetR/AcrR family transcriptional regulator [Spirochaetales bacterium]|nr:TetR/AcrR family transcriptional regulator [Spirochaetales bacterium]
MTEHNTLKPNTSVLELINKPKTARGKKTLARILKAAEDLFSQKGFYNTKITEIVESANVASGTFYIYFPDKKSIFRYLMEELNHALRKEIVEATVDCKNRKEEEKVGFETFFSFVNKHNGLFRIVWDAQFVIEEAFMEYYENFAQHYLVGIKKAQKSGEVKDYDPTTLVYCLMGITNFIALKWIIFEKKPVPQKVLEDVMKIISEGAFNLPE